MQCRIKSRKICTRLGAGFLTFGILMSAVGCDNKKTAFPDTITPENEGEAYFSSSELDVYKKAGSNSTEIISIVHYGDGLAAFVKANMPVGASTDDATEADSGAASGEGEESGADMNADTSEKNDENTEGDDVLLPAANAENDGSTGEDNETQDNAEDNDSEAEAQPDGENDDTQQGSEDDAQPVGENDDAPQDGAKETPTEVDIFGNPLEEKPHHYLVYLDFGLNVQKEIDLSAGLPDTDITFLNIFADNSENICLAVMPESVIAEQSSGEIWLYTFDSQGNLSEDKKVVNSPSLDAMINAEEHEFAGMQSAVVDADGNVFVKAFISTDTDYRTAIVVFDKSGEEQFLIEDEAGDTKSGWAIASFFLLDGNVYVTGTDYKDNGSTTWIAPIDLQKKELGKKTSDSPVGDNFQLLQTGDHGVFYADDRAIFTLDMNTNEGKELLLWENTDFNPEGFYPRAYVLAANKILLTSLWNNPESGAVDTRWFLLEKSDGKPLEDQTVIRIGSFSPSGTDELKNKITEFNSSHRDFHIEVQSFYEAGTPDTEAAYEKAIRDMNASLLSGEMPDILVGSPREINFVRLGQKDMLADLQPLMDKEPEIKKEEFLDNVFDSVLIDGKRVCFIASFTVDGLIGKETVTDKKESWTWDEFSEFSDSLSEDMAPLQDFSRTELLRIMLFASESTYLDMEKGTVDFDTETFRKMLEFCKTWGKSENDLEWTDPWNLMQNGSIAMMINPLRTVMTYSEIQGMMEDKISISGYPSDKASGPMISSNTVYAISASSDYHKEAWDLLKGLLSQDEQENILHSYSGFPVNKSVFEKGIREAMIKGGVDENGQVVHPRAGMPELDKEGAEVIRGMVSKLSAFSWYDAEIMEIIHKETEGYFAGSGNAETISKAVQEKVQEFLDSRD